MQNSLQQHRIPLDKIVEYVKLHKQSVLSMLDLKTQGLLSQDNLELTIYKSFLKLHDFLTIQLQACGAFKPQHQPQEKQLM